jgi:N-acylneuraminate cytidylyltransferase
VTLALIPARGGSKGLPRKNIRDLAGLPLLEHSVRLAGLCPDVSRIVVTTDDAEIASVARAAGAEVLERPAELARDDTPTWPVVRHALDAVGGRSELVLLLEPTSPTRLPEDVAAAHALLAAHPDADGVVAVSEPRFNPIWECVTTAADGVIEHLFAGGDRFERRQNVPRALRINGLLYLWRAEFVRRETERWLRGRHMPLEVPELRAISIDDEAELQLATALLAAGLVSLPWL